MSTKIYTGYVFKKPLSFFEASEFCSVLRKKLVVKQKELLYAIFMDKAVEKYDEKYHINKKQISKQNKMNFVAKTKPSLISEKDNKHCISLTHDYFSEKYRQLEEKSYRCPDIDFSFYIRWYSLKNKTLLYVITEQQDFLNILETMSDISYYGYWNNTDKPDDVSDKEWNQRKKDWDIILNDTLSFYVKLLENKYIMIQEWPELEKYITPLEKRLEKIAYNKILNKKCKFVNTDEIINKVMEVSYWARTSEDGKKAVAKEIEKLRNKIKPLTMHDLMEISK